METRIAEIEKQLEPLNTRQNEIFAKLKDAKNKIQLLHEDLVIYDRDSDELQRKITELTEEKNKLTKVIELINSCDQDTLASISSLINKRQEKTMPQKIKEFRETYREIYRQIEITNTPVESARSFTDYYLTSEAAMYARQASNVVVSYKYVIDVVPIDQITDYTIEKLIKQ